jgi:hypothetical protein
MPIKSVIYSTNGSLPNSQAGAGVYLESQNIGEAYALGALTTVFQSEGFAILSRSNQTICLCPDIGASLLAL